MNRWFATTAGLLAAIALTAPAGESGSSPKSVSGQTVQTSSVADTADLLAGDRAFAQRDFPVAVSFYTKHLQNVEKSQDKTAVKNAYERLLDALVMSRLPSLAEEYLAKYEKLYPGNGTEIAMWRGDILYQQKKYQEAQELYQKLLETLPQQDTRRLRTLFACGLVLEKQGLWKEAANRYEPICRQASGTLLGRRAFIRLILCLASDGKSDPAWELLLGNPPADRESKTAYPLLAAYIMMKQTGVEAAAGAWRSLVRTFRDGPNPLIYMVASTYGDELVKTGALADALLSYRAAFHAASDKNEMFDTLNRMVSIISQTGDKIYAAKLAMSQLELFKESLLSPAIKLRTARLLRDAGNTKGALELYESVFSNMNSSETEKKQAIYEYALLMAQTGRFKEAEKTVRSHFISPNEAEGEFLLAQILVQLDKPEMYCEKYKKIAERWPDKAHRAFMLAARACLDSRQPDRALEFLSALRKRAADPVQLLYLDAVARMQKNQKQASLKLFNDFLQKADPADLLFPNALYYSGLLAFHLHDLPLAAQRLSRFRKTYPKHPLAPQVSAWLIQVYAISGNAIAAERETWLLADQYPESEVTQDALFRLAGRYAEEGAREKAAATLKKMAEDSRFPRIQARALYELALQAYRNGENKKAVRLLAGLHEKFPDSPVIPDAFYLQADILRADSDFKSAIPIYQKVISMRPDSLLAAAARGSVGDSLLAIASQDPASSKNELLSAVQTYKTLLEQPNCPLPFTAMATCRTGRCLELLGQREAASAQYRKVLYQFPARQARLHPVETVWCVRAAEALIDLAGKHPVRTTLKHARYALHWLADGGMISMQEAAERFEKLKNNKFNP